MPEWKQLAHVRSDTAWRRRYRELQSWYRATCLGLKAGRDPDGRLLGNWLPEGSGDSNLLNDTIAHYTHNRVKQVRREEGTIDENRLFRNMLSSMPLCFNLFGYLRAYLKEAAEALSEAIDIDISEIETLEVEWAPAGALLGDKTAFDAYASFRRSRRRSGFLAIETKYTEPFGTRKLDLAKYRLAASSLKTLSPETIDAIGDRLTRQHWRNLLLAMTQFERGEFETSVCVIASCEGDQGARSAVEELQHHLQGGFLVRHLALERFLELLTVKPALSDWARQFNQRYLDLSQMSSDSSGGLRKNQ